VKNISVLIAIGVGTDGCRQILGVTEGEKEDLEGWRAFLCHLKDRGLKGVRLIISDACRGLVEAAAEVFPKTDWQLRGPLLSQRVQPRPQGSVRISV
jgi:putative transposase